MARHGKNRLSTEHFPPASRTDNPITSHLAEEAHTESGARGNHCLKLWRLIKINPGLTSSELAATLNWPFDLQECRRRLSDLRHQEKVKTGRPRLGLTKHKEMTWWLPEDYKEHETS